MENKKPKEYYTFADLMLKLRGEYQEVQSIIRDMEKCISIETPHKVEYELNFSMADPRFSDKENRVAKLVLSVSRKDLSAREKMRKALIYIYGGRHNPITPLIDNASFHWILDEGESLFEFVDKYHYEQAFRPDVVLTDESNFSKLCDRLRRSRLYSLSSLYNYLNWFNRIDIRGDGLSLHTQDKDGKWLSINYIPRIDMIRVSGDASYDRQSLEELFMTKIPKSKLTTDHMILFDSIPVAARSVSLDNVIGCGKEDIIIKLQDTRVKKIGERKPTTVK